MLKKYIISTTASWNYGNEKDKLTLANNRLSPRTSLVKFLILSVKVDIVSDRGCNVEIKH